MLNNLKKIGRAIIPRSLFKTLQPLWHGSNAWLASLYYGQPSDRLIVIGTTGTAGKSTTINALAHILNVAGRKTGFITTTNYNDGKTELLNKHGLSMPGGWLLQKQLRKIVDNGCSYAIVECTSEGLAQNRHFGINFDIALLTNLSPAHLDTHGNFENYKRAKAKLFSTTSAGKRKSFFSQKILGANLDNEHASYFLQFPAEKKFGITTVHSMVTGVKTYTANIDETEPELKFNLNSTPYTVPLVGKFNAYNALLAAACGDMLGIPLTDSSKALNRFLGVAGRMEKIPNARNYTIIVDYACEPEPMQNCLKAVARLPHQKLIHVFGATGGHRDVQKRFDFGRISAQIADIIIITNDDVYDSDPVQIAENINEGINSIPHPERHARQIETILDRRAAIARALQIAEAHDIVLITGKGSEQFLSLPGNQRIAWDERDVVREELTKLS